MDGRLGEPRSQCTSCAEEKTILSLPKLNAIPQLSSPYPVITSLSYPGKVCNND
jgi:hypothetical protein